MTTQHPEALRLAAELDDGYPLTGDAISAAAELRRQHARITELESQLAQRFDAADVATASAQGFRDGVASLTAQAADRAIEGCPELNMGNYDEVDVERLNDWAIRANDEIDRLHALAAGQATAAQQGAAYAELPESFLEIPDVQDESGINTYYSREVVLECIDAALASHGQAPATAQADSVLYDPKAVLEIFNSARNGSDKPVGYMRGILAVIAHWESRPEPHRWMWPAKEADSVQEDAARLDWLDQQCEGYGFQDVHEGNRWEISGPYANVRQAIDYERAARKQGENNDN